jgi:hypothetical protein
MDENCLAGRAGQFAQIKAGDNEREAKLHLKVVNKSSVSKSINKTFVTKHTES